MMLLMNWSDPRWRHPDIRFAVVVGGGVGTMWTSLSMRGVRLISINVLGVFWRVRGILFWIWEVI